MDAREEEVVCCGTCGLAQRVQLLLPRYAALCSRCGSVLSERKSGSVVPTVALSLAALVLYVPANVFPILRMQRYGLYAESTVWEGVAELARLGYWFVALIVFVASIVVPLLKLTGLFFLSATAAARSRRWRRQRTLIYKFIDTIGPWAMLDVFLLAVLVAVVRLGALATVVPGPGLTAFACVVVLTMLASATFDPKLIWQEREPRFQKRDDAEGSASGASA
jgi:paraquat-inducible protein A